MNWFEIIRRYYIKGLYTEEEVKIFVQAEKITEEEYEKIISEEYSA